MAKVSISLVSRVPGTSTGIDMSADGSRISFTTLVTGATGLIETLYVQGTGQLFEVDSFPSQVVTLSISGIDGGALSADGRFVFYSTGLQNGGLSGFAGVNLFVTDLQTLTTTDVTPPPPVLSQLALQGFDPTSISA